MKKFRNFCFGISVILVFISTRVHADTWLFDFGSTAQITAENYNNVTYPGVHNIAGLVNVDGYTTGAALAITVPFNVGSTNSSGTTTPAAGTGFLPTATRDNFFGNLAQFAGYIAPNSQLELSGLDPSLVYDFTIFASRLGVTDNRQTEYKIGGANSLTTYLDAAENQANLATVSGIKPTLQGKIVLDISPGPDNTNVNGFFYLGAMKVVSRKLVPETCDATDSTPDDTLLKYPYVEGESPYILGHWLYRPAGYSYAPCKKYPLLVWLHGAGERCPGASLNALNKASLNAPGYQILQGTAYTDQRPFLNGLILQPQTCGSWNAANIDAMIEYVKTQVRVDEAQIYVTGLSLGGGGTWAYAAGKPTKVAAIVPVAGTESALSSIGNASHVPTWAFHNYNDTNLGPGLGPVTDLFRCKSYTHRQCTVEHIDRMIPFATTRVMENYSVNHGATMASTDRTAVLEKSLPDDYLPTQWLWSNGRTPPGTPKTVMTIFAANGHSGWATAYGMQEMWQWLYAQKLQPAPTVKVNSPLITPINASVTSGATIVISAKIALGGVPVVPLAQVVTDLKSLGGSNVAPLVYDSIDKTYKLSYTLPTSGLQPGAKGIAIVAVDTNGTRTVKYVTFTLDP